MKAKTKPYSVGYLPISTKPCKHCGKPSVSYYRHPNWYYPDTYVGKAEIFPYCAKHPLEVLEACPADVKLIFTNSGRTGSYPDLQNEIILHSNRDIAKGKLASLLLKNKNFPKKNDFRLLDMAEAVEAGKKTKYFVYSSKGVLKREFTNYYDACDYYDPKDEVVAYIGINNFYTEKE